MFKKIKLSHKQYQTLVQVEELLTTEIYSTGVDYVDEEVLNDISKIVEEYQNNNKHEIN